MTLGVGPRPGPDGLPRIGVLGPGRVGQLVTRALAAAGVDLSGIAGRDPDRVAAAAARLGIDAITPVELLGRSDLVLVTVPDQQIAAVAHRLADLLPTARRRANLAIVHCSGATDLSSLAAMGAAGVPVGSWHPLLAIPRPDTELRYGATWAITTDDDGLRTVLAMLSRAVGGVPRLLPEDAKGRYHAAAVLGSNSVVGLLGQAAELLTGCGLAPQEALQALVPLARSAIDALEDSGLPEGLTGPLVRGDVGTIRAHLAALSTDPETMAVYQVLGRATLRLVARQLAPARHDEMLELLGGSTDGSPRDVTYQDR